MGSGGQIRCGWCGGGMRMGRRLFGGGDRRLYMISIPHSAEVISNSILSSASQLCFPCNFHFNIDSDPPPSIGHSFVSITHHRYFNLQTSTSIPTPHSRLIPRLLLHSTYSRNLARHPTSPPGVPDAAICTPNAESACGTAPGTPSRTKPRPPLPFQHQLPAAATPLSNAESTY